MQDERVVSVVERDRGWYKLDRLALTEERRRMTTNWALQDAKNRLSELVSRTETDGPQAITRRGRRVAVVLSAADYAALTAPKDGLVAFLRASPLAGVKLDLRRSDDTGRQVDLDVSR